MNKILRITELQWSCRTVCDNVVDRGSLQIPTRSNRPEGIPHDEQPRLQSFRGKDLAGCFDRLLERMAVGDEAAGQKDVIVSGDNDMATLAPFMGIPILSPAAFLRVLQL